MHWGENGVHALSHACECSQNHLEFVRLESDTTIYSELHISHVYDAAILCGLTAPVLCSIRWLFCSKCC